MTAVRLSGRVLNSSCPNRMLPAALFPDPDRPSRTRRNSGADETVGKEEEEEEEADEDDVEVEEEKTRS